MRAAMAEADVGDDVYGEDPTVDALERRVAELLGHEAALFVPTGSMANQLGVRLLVQPGQELLCDSRRARRPGRARCRCRVLRHHHPDLVGAARPASTTPLSTRSRG